MTGNIMEDNLGRLRRRLGGSYDRVGDRGGDLALLVDGSAFIEMDGYERHVRSSLEYKLISSR